MNVRALMPRRITLRARLTLIYGGLFFVAGLVLLGMTYVLFDQQFAHKTTMLISRGDATRLPEGDARWAYIEDGEDPEKLMRQQQKEVRDAAAAALLTQGGVALVLVGGAAAGFGWLVAGRVLAPLHRVTDTARRISAAPAADKGLHERIALRGPDDEVKDLADTFDSMVERLDRSFDGQRLFVANASHELRTPLTLGRAMVELAMHRRSASADVRRLGEDLLAINTRHERLITGLLLLAGSENEITERLPVDLADIVGHVVAQIAQEATRAGVTMREEAGEASTTGDALLLERLVHNLVENGIRHNVDADGWVRVISRTRDDGRAEVEVSNTGPVVPPYEMPALFEPFRRVSTAGRIDRNGAGLGLSIVQSIARAHGGEAVARPRAGGGLVVTVTLPGSAVLGSAASPLS